MDDEQDFSGFVRARYGDLLRTAFLLTGSPHTAEDLVQTVLAKVYRRWDTIDDPMPYLRRALVNHRNSIWRRISSRELLTGFQQERIAPDLAAMSAQRADLLAALGKLPRRMRTVLVLRYWEDLSETETAQLMGCSTGTVKAQASRGLARLRTALQPVRVERNTSLVEGTA